MGVARDACRYVRGNLKFLLEASHYDNAIEFEDELDDDNDFDFHEKKDRANEGLPQLLKNFV